MYEKKDSFSFVNAMGNSIEDLLNDIKLRLKHAENNSPRVVEVLYDPNGENINVTNKILSLLKK